MADFRSYRNASTSIDFAEAWTACRFEPSIPVTTTDRASVMNASFCPPEETHGWLAASSERSKAVPPATGAETTCPSLARRKESVVPSADHAT